MKKYKVVKSMIKFGFTIIEISIVLVIVGLLIGGILAGSSLIKSAELQSIISNLEKYKIAVNTFESKYNAFPGDMENATSFWGAYAGCNWGENTVDEKTCNGNGDGIIGAPTNVDRTDPAYAYEYYSFWQHLANAKLISGKYTGGSLKNSAYGQAEPSVNVPVLRMGACVSLFRYNDTPLFSTYYPADYKTLFHVGNPEPSDICYNPAFTPSEALSIDTKMDDGLPGKGSIVTLTPDWSQTADCATTSVADTAKYKTSSTGINCNLMFLRIAP